MSGFSSVSSGYFRRFGDVALPLAALTLLHRWTLLRLDFNANFLGTYYNPEGPLARLADWWGQAGGLVLAGIGSDALFVLLAALVLALFRPGLALLALLLLALFYAANIEHVRYNYAHIRLGTIGIGLNWTFIRGSAATSEFLTNLGLLAGGAAVLWSALRQGWLRRATAPAALAVLAAAALLPRGIDPLGSRWMQTHPLMDGARAEATVGAAAGIDGSVFVPTVPATPAGAVRRNLLIVYLEGLSQFSLEQDQMPFLRGLAEENLQFSRYFGAQLMTSNGLYTALSGAMPNFIGAQSPWDFMQDGDRVPSAALPWLLRRQGYRTLFMQGSPTSFMEKDERLRQLGFERVLGRGDWSDFRLQNGWGIDDMSLVDNALARIDVLPADRPWMVSLLTVGTHAPYLVPEDFRPDLPIRERAVRRADAAAEALMAGLRARGLLENTVVIFTADESREPGRGSRLENEIVLNWLPLIVVHPDGLKGRVEWPLSATRFRDLALMAAGEVSLDDIAALHRPEVPLVFGNFYNSRVFWYDEAAARLYACFTGDFLCARFDAVTDLAALGDRQPEGVYRMDALRAVFSAREPVR